MRNQHIKRDSFRTLIRTMPYVAHEGGTIPYRKMSNLTGTPFQRAPDYCAELGDFCAYMEWPPLNCLIVGAKTCRPGKGWWDWKKAKKLEGNLGTHQANCWSFFKAYSNHRELSENIFSGIDKEMDEFLEGR